MTLNKKPLIREDITTDAIFGYVMSKKDNCVHLLRLIFPDLHIKKVVKIQRQKEISLDILRRGTRFDVWAIDSKKRKYDIEMQTTNDPALLRRAMFYHGQINGEQLTKGKKYNDIENSYVVFLCTFDPFGYGDARYDVVTVLDNHRERKVDSGLTTVFLNSKASDKSNLSVGLQDYLNYMNGPVANASDNYLKRLQKDIDDFVRGKDWRKTMLDISEIREEGRVEGRKEEQIESVRSLIAFCKEFKLSKVDTLKRITKRYGSSFSKEELEKLIQEAY